MNQQTILQSNLLDIIFENRNKNYGAYELRVSYNRRMSIALISTTAICIILCFLFITNTVKVLGKEKNIFNIPDKNITEFHPNKLAPASLIKTPAAIKKRSEVEMPPKIVASLNINKLPATPPEISQSLKQVVLLGSNSPQPGDEYDPGRFSGTNEPHAILITGAKPKKNVVLNDADIMPEYPGGTNALLLFLKRILNRRKMLSRGKNEW